VVTDVAKKLGSRKVKEPELLPLEVLHYLTRMSWRYIVCAYELRSTQAFESNSLCAYPVLINSQFPSQRNIWISCFSVFCSQSFECITCQHPWISDTSYFQTSSKDILLVSPPCL